jgi:hypothetical protein
MAPEEKLKPLMERRFFIHLTIFMTCKFQVQMATRGLYYWPFLQWVNFEQSCFDLISMLHKPSNRENRQITSLYLEAQSKSWTTDQV